MEDKNYKSAGLQICLIDSILADGLSDNLKDIGEIGIDALLNDGLLKDVPIVGTVINMGKTALSIRNWFFVRKIINFLQNMEAIGFEEKEKFRTQIDEDEKLKTHVGETLLILLDRFEHLEKATILAKVFGGYLRAIIDYDVFQRLAYAIDRAYINDLQDLFQFFLIHSDPDKKAGYPNWENLYSSGLSKIKVDTDENKYVRHVRFGLPVKISDVQTVTFGYNQYAELLAYLVLGDRFKHLEFFDVTRFKW